MLGTTCLQRQLKTNEHAQAKKIMLLEITSLLTFNKIMNVKWAASVLWLCTQIWYKRYFKNIKTRLKIVKNSKGIACYVETIPGAFKKMGINNFKQYAKKIQALSKNQGIKKNQGTNFKALWWIIDCCKQYTTQ
jgi:hypothetical protein